LEIINILLKNGCDVNIKDENGKTPLHYASQLG
jgi:ankyrin repeat protein